MTFPDEVVAAVCQHMDDDHAEAALQIVQVLGGVPDATAVRTVGVDVHGIDLQATTPTGSRRVTVPFAAPVTDREGLRAAVVELSRRAAPGGT